MRTAHLDEFPEIGRLTERAFRNGPYGHLPVSEERRRLENDAAGRAQSGQLLVAVDPHDRIVGSASVLRALTPYSRVAAEGEAELRLLVVDPSARGQGIGERLVRESLEVALRWGSRALTLDTGSENRAARRLYERTGFTRLSAREASLEGTVAVPVVYRRDLQDKHDVTIRLAREHEHAAIGRLTTVAYEHDYELGNDYRASLDRVAERAAEHEVWVAVDHVSGSLLGTVTTPRVGRQISPLGAPGELDFRLLAVDPAARGRGIGSALTMHVLRLARLRGLERVVMNSGEDMLGAHRLYDGLGFHRLLDRETTIEDSGRTTRLFAFGFDLDGARTE